MDVNVVRIATTVLSFAAFIGIVWWAYHRGSRKPFAVAEQLPFADTVVGPADPARVH